MQLLTKSDLMEAKNCYVSCGRSLERNQEELDEFVFIQVWWWGMEDG